MRWERKKIFAQQESFARIPYGQVYMLKRFITDESGASSIEYAIIAAVVSVVFISALASLATGLSATFEYVSTATGSTTP